MGRRACVWGGGGWGGGGGGWGGGGGGWGVGGWGAVLKLVNFVKVTSFNTSFIGYVEATDRSCAELLRLDRHNHNRNRNRNRNHNHNRNHETPVPSPSQVVLFF